jgi:hypothetical protein
MSNAPVSSMKPAMDYDHQIRKETITMDATPG